MADLIPQRFREAREYLEVTVEEVSRVLGWDVDRLITLEDGTGGAPTGLELAKLSRLYHRPAEWFTGEFTFSPSPGLLGKVENLTTRDRDAVLDFAEFLQCSAELKARKGGPPMAAESPALALRTAVRHHRRYHWRHTPQGRKPGPVTTCPDTLCQIAVARYLAAKDGTDE